MVKYGYARVSSTAQTNNYSLESQREKLIQHGIHAENIYEETASATVLTRPILNQVLDKLQPQDTLVVTSFDRFARSMQDALNTIWDFQKRDIGFVCLDTGLDSSNRNGQLLTLIYAHTAEADQILRKERILEGIEKAKKENKYLGRKTKITADLIKTIEKYQMRDLNNLEIRKLIGVSQSTFYKAMKTIKQTCK